MKRWLFLFFLVFVALLPIWPYSRTWGGVPCATVAQLGLILWLLRRLRVI